MALLFRRLEKHGGVMIFRDDWPMKQAKQFENIFLFSSLYSSSSD